MLSNINPKPAVRADNIVKRMYSIEKAEFIRTFLCISSTEILDEIRCFLLLDSISIGGKVAFTSIISTIPKEVPTPIEFKTSMISGTTIFLTLKIINASYSPFIV
ncbi:MAG: hypothetical protein GF329_20250 [Candidatus Lokiarchaeota archaeon]|nr:hypothetical protein [Candidatus Lokiarchaeota archaeon]